MNYEQALDYIFSYTDYEKVPMPHALGSYDLRRVEELLSRLGNPHLKARSVHIAGTNGKGSTAAMIASVLTCAGYDTGLYTSPHLSTIRERFRVNGRLITEVEFTDIVAKLKPEVGIVNQKATYGELTTFELLTALAFAYFSMKAVDFQVIEVGLGGKFDATNVIQPAVCVITAIGLDHTQVLGSSLAEIATEKAGIIKVGSTVVCSPQTEEVALVIEEVCRQRDARLIMVGRDVTWRSLGTNGDRQLLEVSGIKSKHGTRSDSGLRSKHETRSKIGMQNEHGTRSLYKISIPLLGKHQMENAATAVAALEVLALKGFKISDSITDGLAQVSWPGRFQVLSRSPLLVVDGAHNPDAARKLKQSLAEYFSFRRAILIMGASEDKDVSGVVSELMPFFSEVIVTQSKHPRAMAVDQLQAVFKGYGVETQLAATVPEALSLALSRGEAQNLICVAGSLFVVAEAIEWVNTGKLVIKERQERFR
jgi:dihydrofolate synthase/folylpolyglutamate synthase